MSMALISPRMIQSATDSEDRIILCSFVRFDTIPACDGQTDGQTDGRTDRNDVANTTLGIAARCNDTFSCTCIVT